LLKKHAAVLFSAATTHSLKAGTSCLQDRERPEIIEQTKLILTQLGIGM
jgi:hypothetical protein